MPLITRAQLAKELKITPKWVDECRSKGRLPDYEPGTKLFGREKALEAWKSWQHEVNDEDPDSVEYLTSVLRLWRSRVELSRQKAAALWRTTIIAQAAESGYNAHRDAIWSNLQQWAEESASKAAGLFARPEISRVLTDACHSAIERLNQGSEGEVEHARDPRLGDQGDVNEDLDLKKCIERAKVAHNHSEARIREIKAGIISGELLLFADVVQVTSERVASAKINFLALPARSANSIAGRTKDAILIQLQGAIDRIMDNVPAWNVADFRPADSVIAGLKSDLKEQPKGDSKPEEHAE